VLLIDGIDEASSYSKAIEDFVRACVEAGVRCIATSRPEGIEDRSAYQSREGWDELHLPELTIDQQRQLVKNVVDVKSKGKLAKGARIELLHGHGHGLPSREGQIRLKRDDGTLDILWDDSEGQQQGVDASKVRAIGGKVFFDNLFNFTESRKQYDAGYMNLEEGSRAALESKTLPIQTKVEPPMFRNAVGSTMVGMTITLTNIPGRGDFENRKATVSSFDGAGYAAQLWKRTDERVTIQFENIVSSTETAFQVGKGGIRIDFGLSRDDLIKMFDRVKAISAGLGEDEGKEKDKVAQLQMLSSASAFSLQFGEIGARVFELFEIAQVANKVLATVLKDVCSEALPPNNDQAPSRDQAAFSIVFGEGLKWFERRAGMLSLYEGVDRRIKDFLQKPVLILCDLKGIKRVLEKAIQDYSEKGDEEGGLRKVIDIVRASIMCDTPKEMGKVLGVLEKSPRVKIARFKNFFRDLDATHFRRMAVNLVVLARVGDKDIPHIVELQIHLRDIFQFKQNNKEFMHRPYEYFREAGKKEVVMPRLKKQMDAMTEIAETPVLLALFCSAANFDGAERPTLPSSRYELYQWALAARLKDHEGLLNLYQAVAFENFISDGMANKRQFVIADVEKARAKWQVGCEFPDYRRGASMPFIKVLDASVGLFQFSHLSMQEAFAGFHGKKHFLEAKFVLDQRALNFVKICERGSLKVKLEASVMSIEKHTFGFEIKGEWLPHFMLLCTASPNCAELAASLQKLYLHSCNLTGWLLGD
jgi:hypothetical protein